MKLTFLLLLIGTWSVAQTPEKLKQVITKMNSVKDYAVSAKIKTDIPMIKMLPTDAQFYFKQTNQFKVESKGIAILPKQGISELNTFLADDANYTALEGGVETIEGVASKLFTIVPTGDNEMILAKIWIDEKRTVLTKTQMTTKSNGTVSVTYAYADQVEYGLPSKMLFTIDVKEFKIPKSMAADIHKTNKTEKDTRKTGTIQIDLSNYLVNQGLSDDFFKK